MVAGSNHKNKPQYNGINLLKYVMAYAVVTIHLCGIEKWTLPWYVEWLIRQAVPFYFMASGFLMGRNTHELSIYETQKYYLNRGENLIKIYGVWLLIYLPLAIYKYWGNVTYVQALWDYGVSIVINGESPLAWPLWFVYSLGIYCICTSYSINNVRKMHIMALILFLLYLMQPPYSRVLSAGIYALCGLMLSRVREVDKYFWSIFILVPLSIVMYKIDIPFSEIIGGMAFMLLGMRAQLPQTKIWGILRIESAWIYFTHMYVIVFVYLLQCHSPYNYDKLHVISVTFFLCGLLGYFLFKAQKVPRLQALGKLIK
ncbi:MAG: acyltransferase [Muribaculaceae bacterium]|nr:acyltransferase [Muribaculaceae bacterium]